MERCVGAVGAVGGECAGGGTHPHLEHADLDERAEEDAVRRVALFDLARRHAALERRRPLSVRHQKVVAPQRDAGEGVADKQV